MNIDEVKEQKVGSGAGTFTVIIGQPGAGKSSMASTFPKSLCVDLEGTAGNIKGLKRIKLDRTEGSKDGDNRDKAFLSLCDITKQFLEGETYDTLVLDGGLEFLKICEDFALKDLGRKNIRDAKFGDTYLRRREIAETYIKKTIGNGKNLVFVAHVDEVTEVAPETDEEYTIHRPLIGDKVLVYKIPALSNVVGMVEVDKNGKRWFNCVANNRNTLKNQYDITEKLEANYEALKTKIDQYYKESGK